MIQRVIRMTIYLLVNQLVDPEHHQFVVETNLPICIYVPGSMFNYQRVIKFNVGIAMSLAPPIKLMVGIP